MLLAGDGIEKNEKKAARYFQVLADRGNAESSLMLGLIFYEGNGIDIDKQQAFRYLTQVAHYEFANAVFYAGKMLYEGDGIIADKKEALKYIIKSASKGLDEAKEQLLFGRKNYVLNKLFQSWCCWCK